MARRTLQKWHGAGNDFLVDVQEFGQAPWWTPARARAVCDRAKGVGADGLLVATLGSEVAMTLYNADGTTAEMSGNGIRCLAAAVRRTTRGVWHYLDVTTEAGVKRVHLVMEDDVGEGSVAMGDVTIDKDVEGALGVAHVGNPHVVVLDDPNWTSADCETLAARLSAEVGGANVEFITPVTPERLRLRVIERGVGWTLACGTGSCAVAVIGRRAGLNGDHVVIENPGGDLVVDLDDDGARLSGPVQFVANVEWLES